MSDRQAQGRARARGYTAVNLSHEAHEGRGQAPVRGSGMPVSGQGPRPSWGPGAGEGRAMVHREHSAGRGASSSTGNGNGDNGNGSSAPSSGGAGTRGAMRGRRTIGDTLRTRALDAPSKQGTTGQPLQLTSNYFKLLRHIEWTLHQYRVDFAPQCASARLMQGLIKDHKKTFGGYIFDGTQLFMVNKLRSDQLTLQSKHDRTGDVYQIKIVHTATVDMPSCHAVGGQNLQPMLLFRVARPNLSMLKCCKNFDFILLFIWD